MLFGEKNLNSGNFSKSFEDLFQVSGRNWIIILSVSECRDLVMYLYDQYDDHMLSLTTTMWLWRPIVILIKQIGVEVEVKGISQNLPTEGGLVNSRWDSPPRVGYGGTMGGEDILFQFPVLLLPTIRTPPPIWDQTPQQPPRGWELCIHYNLTSQR